MRRILLAFILIAATSGLALAAVNDIKVSGDIKVTAVARDLSLGNEEYNVNGNSEFEDLANRDSEDFFLSQVRLRVDADLTENVSAVVQIINERIWGAEDEVRQPQIAGWNSLFTNSQGAGRVQAFGEVYWDEMHPSDTDIQLDLAYFTMKEMLYEPLTLTIGRQNLQFGSAMIIGDPDPAVPTYLPSDITNPEGFMIISGGDTYVTDGGLRYIADDLSLQKSFDAIRATLDYSPLVIDLVYSMVRENLTDVTDDIHLYGTNMAYQLDETTLLEGYVWIKQNDQLTLLELTGFAPVHGQDEDDTVITLGVRAETAVTDQLSLFGEYAHQFGEAINIWGTLDPNQDFHAERDAFAVQVGGSFAFDDDNSSKVALVYSFFSGEDDLANDTWEQWDPMFEDQNGGELANLFVNTGVQCVKLTGSTMPREDLTAILDFYWYRAVTTPILQAFEDGTRPGNALVGYITGPLSDQASWVDRDEKDFGTEVDLSLIYDYTEDVQMGLVSAWFMPGDFFTGNNDETAYQIRTYASVDF